VDAKALNRIPMTIPVAVSDIALAYPCLNSGITKISQKLYLRIVEEAKVQFNSVVTKINTWKI